MQEELRFPYPIRQVVDRGRHTCYFVLSDVAEFLGMSKDRGERSLRERLAPGSLVSLPVSLFGQLPVAVQPPASAVEPQSLAPPPPVGAVMPPPVAVQPPASAVEPQRLAPPPPVGAVMPQSDFAAYFGESVACVSGGGFLRILLTTRSNFSEDQKQEVADMLIQALVQLAEVKEAEAEMRMQLQKQEHAAQLRRVEEVSPGTGQKLLSKEKADQIQERVRRIAAKTVGPLRNRGEDRW